MTLDDLLTQNAAWLEQALKRRMFDKVDDAAIKFPDEQRERRMAEIDKRIAGLAQRSAEVAASYDQAIALEKTERDALENQASPITPSEPDRPGTRKAQKTKKPES